MENFVKKKLSRAKPVVGTWSIVGSPTMTEIASSAGLDFVLLDLEHGAFDLGTLENCIRAAETAGCSPIVRVPRAGASVTQNALDLGAHGVIIPQIRNCAEARDAVASAKFPPTGTRGFNPYTRSGSYSGLGGAKKPRLENDFGLTSVIIETTGAFDELDQIVNLEGLDVIYLGVYDMSLALGARGDVSAPAVKTFIDVSVSKIRKAGKVAGALFKTEAELKRLTELGVSFLVYGVDSWVYGSAMARARSMVDAL